MSREVREKVYSAEQYDDIWPVSYDTTLVDFIAWLNQKLQEIPAEYRSTALIDIGSVGGYEGEHHAEMNITFKRPETEYEIAANEAREAATAEHKRHQELATLKALQKKYGNR